MNFSLLSNKSTPNLNALKISDHGGLVATASSPGLCKPTSSAANTLVNGSHNSNSNHSGSSCGGLYILHIFNFYAGKLY